jgi:DNA-directed RNA polymerase subunit beta'
LNLIEKHNISDIEVRCPLTCKSSHSICQLCYGWSPSSLELIELGAAVGLTAAQSIGEPGTQLTLRTFHSGGIFRDTTSVTENFMESPVTGILKYEISPKDVTCNLSGGERATKLGEDRTLTIKSYDGTSVSFSVLKGTMLMVRSNRLVVAGQALALGGDENQQNKNRTLPGKETGLYALNSGEIFFHDIKLKEHRLVRFTKKEGSIWILRGTPITFQPSYTLCVNFGQSFKQRYILANKRITNKYPGIVNLDNFSKKKEIEIINSSLVLENATIFQTSGKDDILKITGTGSEIEFNLHVRNNEQLTQGQVIASSNEEIYNTSTGGIIYYEAETLPVTLRGRPRKGSQRPFNGFLYWIPEETHKIEAADLPLDDIQNVNGKYVSKGTKIFPHITANISGIISFNQRDSELVIKPGELYDITDCYDRFEYHLEVDRRF